jgi:metal-responsive CopG/Arc/MetJ family transcriptional regulator
MQTQIVNFSIPKKLLKTVDGLAELELKTRSELLRDALRDYLEKRLTLKKRWEVIFDYGQEKAEDLRLKETDIEKLVDEYREGK